MTVTSLLAVVAPRTGKIIKIQNGKLNFEFKLSQHRQHRRKTERSLALKGLIGATMENNTKNSLKLFL